MDDRAEPRLALRYRQLFGAGQLRLRALEAYDARTGEHIHHRRLPYGPRKFARWQAFTVEVAGESYRPDELQHPGFAVGQPVLLRPEDNPHDPNAVAIWDASNIAQCGYVPREQAPLVRQLLAAGPLEAVVCAEWRRAGPAGERVSVRVLLHRPGAVRIVAAPPSEEPAAAETVPGPASPSPAEPPAGRLVRPSTVGWILVGIAALLMISSLTDGAWGTTLLGALLGLLGLALVTAGGTRRTSRHDIARPGRRWYEKKRYLIPLSVVAGMLLRSGWESAPPEPPATAGSEQAAGFLQAEDEPVTATPAAVASTPIPTPTSTPTSSPTPAPSPSLTTPEVPEPTAERLPPGVPEGAQRATVARHVDGDTLWVEVAEPGGPLVANAAHKIRLLLIDAPETVAPGQPVQCGGPEASRFIAEQLPIGSTVYLLADEEDTDRYGRFLRYVWAADGTFFNAEAVRQGHARVTVFQPNDALLSQIAPAEVEARAAGRGLWGPPCDLDAPPPPAPAPQPFAPAVPPAAVQQPPGQPEPRSGPFPNCAAARAAGAAPVYRGDPGYGPHLDRDGDGIGCE